VYLSQAARHLGSANAIYGEVAATSVPFFRAPAAKTTSAGICCGEQLSCFPLYRPPHYILAMVQIN
jgi:hypothetical protein